MEHCKQEERIGQMETTSAVHGTKIDNLADKLSKFTNAIMGLIATIIAGLIVTVAGGLILAVLVYLLIPKG